MARGAGLALAALLLLAVPAAADLQAEVELWGPATVQGDAAGEAGWLGSLHDARQGRFDAVPVLFTGSATVLNYTYLVSEQDASSPTGFGRNSVLLGRSEWRAGDLSGPLTFAAPAGDAGNASLRLLPGAGSTLGIRGGFTLRPPLDLHAVLFRQGDAQPFQEGLASYPPAGALLQGASAAPPAFRGRLVATGAAVAEEPRLGTAWSLSGPGVDGLGSGRVLRTRVLVLDGEVRLQRALDASWTSVVDWLEADVAGDLFLQNAQGTGTLNGTALPSGLQTLQANGDMHVQAQASGSSTRWRLTGEPWFVTVNGETLWGDRWDGLRREVVVGGLAAAALFALYKLGAAKGLLAGLNRADPVGNERRRDILQLISAEPGISTMAIVKRQGLVRAVARHHLGVLTRAELITPRRLGNTVSYTLNNATFDFAVPGTRLNAAVALGRFGHPARAAIKQALEALPGQAGTYAAIAEAWRARGLPVLDPKAFSYHAQALLRQGLLTRTQAGRQAVWGLPFRSQELLDHQRQAYAQAGGHAAVVRALREAARPLTLADLHALMRAGGEAPTRRRLGQCLAVLVATGHVEREGERFQARSFLAA